MEIYRIRLSDLTDEAYTAAFARMSPARQEKCLKYKREEDRRCCIAADDLLRRVLSEMFGVSREEIRVALTPEGKPYAPDLPVFFSYAHAKDRIVLAADREKEVGTDVEEARPIDPRITRYFCCDEDLAYIFTRPEDRLLPAIDDPVTLRRLFEVWTFKESLGKAWGTGLTRETKYAPFGAYQKELLHDGAFVYCAYRAE